MRNSEKVTALALTQVVNLREESYDVYIGRGSIWGNPYIIGKDGTREEVVQKYKEYITSAPPLIEMAKRELKGKKLGCFCAPKLCHGDILVEFN